MIGRRRCYLSVTIAVPYSLCHGAKDGSKCQEMATSLSTKTSYSDSPSTIVIFMPFNAAWYAPRSAVVRSRQAVVRQS